MAVTPSLTAKRERRTDNSCSAVSSSDCNRGDSFSIILVIFCSNDNFVGKGNRRREFDDDDVDDDKALLRSLDLSSCSVVIGGSSFTFVVVEGILLNF